MDRTIKLRLTPSPAQTCALAETACQFTRAFNAVCAYGWRAGEGNGTALHHATYRNSKVIAPGLVSDLHIQARVKATEAIKSARALKKKGKTASAPRSNACPPRYNAHTYKLDWNAGVVNLSTASGRQHIPFTVPPYAQKYAGYPVATADLIRKGFHWDLYVVVSVPVPEITPTDEVIGVDFGVNRAAVTSDNRFVGERRWRELEARDFRLRRVLQKKGTKSAKRHLRRLSGKTARRRRDHDHVVSKRIAHGTPEGSTLSIENLTNIRSHIKARTANGGQRRLHAWSFASLRALLAYKCEERGIRVEGVDPRYTSQTCSRCCFKHKGNRKTQSEFWCRRCGYRTNADRNGAINIKAKLLAGRGMSALGGVPSATLSCPPASVGEAQAVLSRGR